MPVDRKPLKRSPSQKDLDRFKKFTLALQELKDHFSKERLLIIEIVRFELRFRALRMDVDPNMYSVAGLDPDFRSIMLRISKLLLVFGDLGYDAVDENEYWKPEPAKAREEMLPLIDQALAILDAAREAQ